MLDLSIIIPIYNTPIDTLERCLESVKTLAVSNYEVLLIDDGSQPSVGNFCKNYVSNNDAYRYFYKENGGVSSARNTGLSYAQGRYITFLDADDTLLGQVFTAERLNNNYDLVIFDLELIENSAAVWHAFDRESGLLPTEDLLRALIASKSINGPVGKLYKHQIIVDNNILFDPSFINGEDWDFVCRYSLFVNTVYYCSECSYRYYRDGNTSKSRIDRFPDVVLSNVIAMYDKKQQILDRTFSCTPDSAQLHSTAAVLLIEGLFNSAAELHILRKLTKERKTLILETCRRAAMKLLPTSPKKTRMKHWILQHCFFLVYPLAYMREFYLKHKH